MKDNLADDPSGPQPGVGLSTAFINRGVAICPFIECPSFASPHLGYSDGCNRFFLGVAAEVAQVGLGLRASREFSARGRPESAGSSRNRSPPGRLRARSNHRLPRPRQVPAWFGIGIVIKPSESVESHGLCSRPVWWTLPQEGRDSLLGIVAEAHSRS